MATAFDIPLTTGLRRRASAVALMARTVPRAGIDAAELQTLVTRIAAEADGAPLDVVVPALWRIEATLAGAARHPRPRNRKEEPRNTRNTRNQPRNQPRNTRNTRNVDPCTPRNPWPDTPWPDTPWPDEAAPLLTHPLPERALPIAHVGWATGVAQRLGFDPAVLRDTLQRSTCVGYQGFGWDGIGADLLVHARPAVRIGGRAIGMVGGGAEPPDSSRGFAAFRAAASPEENRLAAHGLGRMLLVTHASLRAALQQAEELPNQWRRPAVQGVAFACFMLNYEDAPALLEESRQVSGAMAPAFHDGLVYALVFADWLGRGLLESWEPSGSFEAELVTRARREAELSVRRGRPLAFAVSA